jgi:hypothetical protein
MPWPQRVRFEAANTGRAGYADPSLLDRYLDPDHERALRSLAAADEAARTRRDADRDRRLAVSCRNATPGISSRYCGCVYCDTTAHTAPDEGTHWRFAEPRCLCGTPVPAGGQRCRRHRDTHLVVLDDDPVDLQRLSPSRQGPDRS